jgi:hypothetical protein
MGILFALVKINDSNRRKFIDRVGFTVDKKLCFMEMYYDINKCLLNIKNENKYISGFAKAMLRIKNREEINNNYSINFVKEMELWPQNDGIGIRYIYSIKSVDNIFIEELDHYNA